MKITIEQSNQLKGIAILMMLVLHLFNTLEYKGLFTPLVFIGDKPLIYYISLFCDACVPIFAFVSGYGLFFKYRQDPSAYGRLNWGRIKKVYINLAIVILFFPVILGTILGDPEYPGSLLKLMLNLTAIDVSYNGAWWFFTIYILFILTSKFWFRLIDKLNPLIYFSVLLILYVLGFYFRIYNTGNYSSPVLNWIHMKSALYFCTLFQFMLGAFSSAFNWSGKFYESVKKYNHPTLIGLVGIFLLFILHSIIPNFIIAPLTGIGFILFYLFIKVDRRTSKLLHYFGTHSTNIWLVHMFFYITFFRKFIYSPEYVPLIFLTLLICSLAASYLINFTQKLVEKVI